MAPHNAWNVREYGRTASPPEARNRFTETARAFKKSQVTFCRHKGTFPPNTANLPAPEPAHRQRFGWSSVSYQIPRPGLFRTESWNPSGYVTALDTLLDAASNAHINRGGIYCFSHSFTCHTPRNAVLLRRYRQSETLVGKITDLQCSTKRIVLIKFNAKLS